MTAIRVVLLVLFVASASAGFADPQAGAVPFIVSGTIVAGLTKVAIIVVQDDQGRATAEQLVHEGDVVSGYRVSTIHHDRVTFERDAESVHVRVGNNGGSSPPSDTAVVIPYQHTKEVPVKIGPPPENIDEVRKQMGTLLEQLKGTAQFRNAIDAAAATARERERAAPNK